LARLSGGGTRQFFSPCRLFLEWPEIPQRAGKGRASGHSGPIKAYTFQTESLNGSSRGTAWHLNPSGRAFQRPRSHEMAFPPVWRCGEAFRAFFGDAAL
jgi:hypothetical protein